MSQITATFPRQDLFSSMLPKEIQLNILKYCPAEAVGSLCGVNRYFNQMCTPLFQSRMAQANLDPEYRAIQRHPKISNGLWKNTYRDIIQLISDYDEARPFGKIAAAIDPLLAFNMVASYATHYFGQQFLNVFGGIGGYAMLPQLDLSQKPDDYEIDDLTPEDLALMKSPAPDLLEDLALHLMEDLDPRHLVPRRREIRGMNLHPVMKAVDNVGRLVVAVTFLAPNSLSFIGADGRSWRRTPKIIHNAKSVLAFFQRKGYLVADSPAEQPMALPLATHYRTEEITALAAQMHLMAQGKHLTTIIPLSKTTHRAQKKYLVTMFKTDLIAALEFTHHAAFRHAEVSIQIAEFAAWDLRPKQRAAYQKLADNPLYLVPRELLTAIGGLFHTTYYTKEYGSISIEFQNRFTEKRAQYAFRQKTKPHQMPSLVVTKGVYTGAIDGLDAMLALPLPQLCAELKLMALRRLPRKLPEIEILPQA
jgi:hypothetical protein